MNKGISFIGIGLFLFFVYISLFGTWRDTTTTTNNNHISTLLPSLINKKDILSINNNNPNAILQASIQNNNKEDTIKIICLGDSHSRHNQVQVPFGDVLLHSGDFSMFGKESDIISFNTWLGTLPHQHKVIVSGNHDGGGSFQKSVPNQLDKLKKMIPNAIILMDQAVELPIGEKNSDGEQRILRVYGSPWQPQYRGFATYKSEENAENIWHNTMPKDNKRVDILLTHSPPFSIFDFDGPNMQIGIGSKGLLKVIADRKPLLHCFGHIHFPGLHTLRAASSSLKNLGGSSLPQKVKGEKDQYYELKLGHTLFVNDALVTDDKDETGIYKFHKDAHPIVLKMSKQLLQKINK